MGCRLQKTQTTQFTTTNFHALCYKGLPLTPGEPYHRNSKYAPILKPNFICAEENGRHCYITGMNSNYYRIPGQTLVKDSFIQLLDTPNLIHLHSLNPTVPIIEHAMPINVKDSHPIILGESLLPWRLLTIQLGFFHEYNN